MAISYLEDFIKYYEVKYTFSVSVSCLFIDNDKNQKKVFSRQSRVKHHAASLAKLFILGAVAEEIAHGRCSLTKQLTVSSYVAGSGLLKYVDMPITLTVQELTYLMIAYSDNSATNTLLSLVATERVNKFITSLGAQCTKIIVPMMPNTLEAQRGYNYTIADDVTLFYGGVVNGFPAPIHESTGRICRELLNASNGSLASIVQFLASGTNARCAIKIIRSNPFRLIKYLYAISTPLWRKRLTAHIPEKQIIAQKSATSRNTFHDSCLIKMPGGFLCIVSMIECSSADFYKRKLKSYRLADTLISKVGEILFMIQK